MNTEDYKKKVLRTEPKNYEDCFDRLKDKMRLLHATVGLSTESSELLDLAKKFVFYGKKIDREKIIDEAGDVLWYLNILFDTCDFTIEEAMAKNIKKLEQRYKGDFDCKSAINPNKTKEWEAQNEDR